MLEPLTDPEQAMAVDSPQLHLSGNILRHVRINHGDADAHAEVVVSGEYEVGMQDQAFLGPESGLAAPNGEGGVDLYIATQWLHVDRDQLALSLDLPPEKVRLTTSGVGGAFGGREDLSMQIHACMLALHTGRPVRMVYNREESFFGHVHRHPCRMRYEHGATADGRLVYVRARIVLDGGAYASSSTAVCSNAACFAAGPYDVPNARIDSYVTYTNNPPCGAMRGFGSVQVAVAHEAQMDKLAARRWGSTRWSCGSPTRCGRARACRRARRFPSRRPLPSCLSASARCLCRRRRLRKGVICASSQVASPTPLMARACGAASATRWG